MVPYFFKKRDDRNGRSVACQKLTIILIALKYSNELIHCPSSSLSIAFGTWHLLYRCYQRVVAGLSLPRVDAPAVSDASLDPN